MQKDEEIGTPEEISTGSENSKEKGQSWSIKELAKFALIAAIIVIPIRFFVAEPYLVRQTSMLPTFENNDYLVVEKIGTRFREPERGDVIIFRSPTQEGKTLIKRIVGLPGEIIRVRDGKTFIRAATSSADFLEIEEPYVKNPSAIIEAETILGENEYFVMGDNRGASLDSRSWGPINKDSIIGRPLVRMYKFSSASLWPGMEDLPEIKIPNSSI